MLKTVFQEGEDSGRSDVKLEGNVLRAILSSQNLTSIVPITVQSLDDVSGQWRAIANAGANMVEWRLDHLERGWELLPQIASIAVAMRKECGIPVLATWRTKHEGGLLDLEKRGAKDYSDLVRSVSNWADLVDVEISRDGGRELVTEIAGETLVVASFHQFHPPIAPQVLRGKLMEMQNAGASVLKIAAIVDSNRDLRTILSLQDWASALETPSVIIGMGQEGQQTRLGERAERSAFAFATLGVQSAPGQPTLEQLNASVDQR